MARINVPVVKYTVNSPARGPGYSYISNTYGQILCEGPGGEVLLLVHLRPDTTWPTDPAIENPIRANSYDPVSKSGVAYFQACDFARHIALLKSGKTVQAEVDDAYPDGNRLFTEVAMPAPANDPVPDVVAWLKQHMNVWYNLKWNEPDRGGLMYGDWPKQKQQDFVDAFAAAWNHLPMALDDPPPNMADFDLASNPTVFDSDHAWRLFCAHVAYSLALEIGGRVPWSILGYSASDLEMLLHGGNMFHWYSKLNGYALNISAVPAPPEFTWAFLEGNNLIGEDRISTIANVLDWCRNNLVHFYYTGDSSDTNILAAHWGYSGLPPVSRIIQGTVRAGRPQSGIKHFTMGCFGTTAFLQAVLRTINIPVETINAGGHTTPHFTTDNLYLSHGDDPYDQNSKCTPPFDARLLLIDSNTFDNWFGPNVPKTTAENNVGRRPTELSVQYLSDYMLHLYRQDRWVGNSPETGKVYQFLQRYYPNFTDIYPDFWDRMGKKLLTFGLAGRKHFYSPRWTWLSKIRYLLRLHRP